MEQRVYVIAARDEGPCKIGLAKDAQSRLSELQTGHPERLEVKWNSLCPAGPRLERWLHSYLAPRRLKGEWFDITVAEAGDALLDWHLWGPELTSPAVAGLSALRDIDVLTKAIAGRMPQFTDTDVYEVLRVAGLLGYSRPAFREYCANSIAAPPTDGAGVVGP